MARARERSDPSGSWRGSGSGVYEHPEQSEPGSEATLQGSWRGSGSAPADPDPDCARSICRGKDSNLRRLSRRVYSPLPLAARAPLRDCWSVAVRGAYDPRVERFDAIVVGAGPAGSATAIRLARGGATVLLADRARFPRDKPCGGGLTGRAVRELPVDVSPVVEDVVRCFEVRLRYRKRFERRSETPLVLMTRRRRLDAFLAEQAAAAGADFRDGVTVEGLTVGPDGATLAVGGREVHGRVVVGADGVNGRIARSAGLGGGIIYGIALEGNGPLRDGATRAGDGRARRRAGRLRLGLSEGRPRELRRRRLGERGAAPARAPAPPLRRPRRRRRHAHGSAGPPPPDPPHERVPAAGRSSSSATPPVSSTRSPATASTRLCSRRVSPRPRSSRHGSTTTSRSSTPPSAATPRPRGRRSSSSTGHPRAAFAVARLPGVWNVIAGLITGDVTHPSDAHGLARPPLRLLARL